MRADKPVVIGKIYIFFLSYKGLHFVKRLVCVCVKGGGCVE